jgi:23S rRNA pseudouridine1911/1915/1917 synthase
VELTVTGALAGERLDRVVALITGLARAEAAALVDAGAVTLAGRKVATRSRRLNEGDELVVALPDRTHDSNPVADASVAVAVVWADPHVVVVDKPAGLVVHPGAGTPGRTLVNGLLARFPDLAAHPWPDPLRPGVVHRLDKGTSGLLVVARTPDALAALAAQLRARAMDRRYLALVHGSTESDAGVIDAPLGRSARDPVKVVVRADGRRAATRYEVVARFTRPALLTLLRCQLETGRTHQIRVHLAAIGHPVAGDTRYGQRAGAELGIGRPFLHAAHLAFEHPVSGRRHAFDADLPADLREPLEGLRS